MSTFFDRIRCTLFASWRGLANPSGVTVRHVNDTGSNGTVIKISSLSGSCCASVIIRRTVCCFLPLSTVAAGISHTTVLPPSRVNLPVLKSGDCMESKSWTSAAAGCIRSNGRVPAPVWFIEWLFAQPTDIPRCTFLLFFVLDLYGA